MPDNKNPGVERNNNSEGQKKRSFFGGSLDINSKDLLDFRYNTQEEIDKFNEEMTTTGDLDEIMKESKDTKDEIINDKDENYIKEKDKKEAESNLEIDLQGIDEPNDPVNNENIDNENEEGPIEGEIVDDNEFNKESENDEPISNNENINDNENFGRNDSEIESEISSNDDNKIDDEEENNEDTDDEKLEKVQEENDNSDNTEDEKKDDENEENLDENESLDSVKFFDPFELDFEENEESLEGDNEIFDPFGLNEEENNSENVQEEIENKEENEVEDEEENKVEDEEENEVEDGEKNEVENEEDNEIEDEEDNEIEDEEENEVEDGEKNEVENEEDNEIEDEEDNEVEDEEDNEIEDEEDNEIEDEEDNEIEDEEDNEIEDEEENITINTPIAVNPNQKNENEESLKERKIKKNSTTGEEITEEEIQLEQGQDMPNTEDDEEYQPSAEEIFEYEPEFFADDELSQQFMLLVQNTRGIFKLERKDGEQNPYFKILGGKTANSTLEYLFYLIEEDDEPIDLYIKKIETNQKNGEENEHLVQFSYNEDKELNIFVDEVILYEKVNKSDSNATEYNDTKSILEKFIFLTENYYDKLKSELDKQREEKQKKRQLQQIFKGF